MRVLKVTISSGAKALVNTTNITSVVEDGTLRLIYTNDESEPIFVQDTFDSIVRAWRYGNSHGETGVFDAV